MCLGNTFAMNALKVIAVLLLEYFDFEMVDEKYSGNNYPRFIVSSSSPNPVEVKFKEHKLNEQGSTI